MTARPLPWFRAARRGWQRDAWVAFEGRAGDRAGSPTPGAHDAADPWVVDYQRGEIRALVQRLKEQDLRLERRTRALAAALAMLALGVIGQLLTGSGRHSRRLPQPRCLRRSRSRSPLRGLARPRPGRRPQRWRRPQ